MSPHPCLPSRPPRARAAGRLWRESAAVFAVLPRFARAALARPAVCDGGLARLPGAPADRAHVLALGTHTPPAATRAHEESEA
ncbi:hypothetical protein [Lysobacter sp. yr284]|uniref:hypothetical protein n=1 Tax=Lysobacter sp. yr284 TaxID=1761791 RepID=UPI0011132F5A|nr:hypothetical protein [Lysobacter sp. yr284]